jgi:hypothetical protein
VDDRDVGGDALRRGERVRPELAAQIVVADRLKDRLELLGLSEDIHEKRR